MQKNKISILGLATVVPPYSLTQDEYADFIVNTLSLSGRREQFVRAICSRSAIEKRHFVVDDSVSDRSTWKFFPQDFPQSVPTMTERNLLYKDEAPKLAHKAAEKALKSWGGDAQKITHVISVSCTGVLAPGIEFLLVKELNLSQDVQRFGINMMGCFGAFRGLAVARALALEDPANRILVVCTELCSIHVQAKADANTVIGNALFADGAAAVVVGAQPTDYESSLWDIIHHKAYAHEGSLGDMSWEASDTGFLMTLTAEVPRVIHREIKKFSEILLPQGVSLADCFWPVHPGGKAILEGIEEACQLERWQTQAAWNVLAERGNMSSATFLFVLEEQLKQPHANPWAIGLGFGPGLSLEGVLLHRGQ